MKKIVDLQFNYDKANDYCITEGKFVNSANEEYYVAVSRSADFVNINIANESLFDDLLKSSEDDIFEVSMKSIYEFAETIDDWSSGFKKLEYYNEMKLVLYINDKILHDMTRSFKNGQSYIAKYKNKDVDATNIPLVTL